MKKIFSLFLIFALILSLTSCGTLNFVDIEEFTSDVYTEDDITSAMEVVLESFRGRTDTVLLRLSYIGDEKLADYQDWADRNNADDVIVFLTDYYISFFSDNPIMNTGFKYEDYNYILVRSDGGEWEIVDHGY